LEGGADAIENKEICFGSYRSYDYEEPICRRQSLLFTSSARQLIWRREMRRNSTVLRSGGAHHPLNPKQLRKMTYERVASKPPGTCISLIHVPPSSASFSPMGKKWKRGRGS